MALRSPCLSVLASKPGPGLPANWRDCISPGGEAGRPSLAPRQSVKTPVASEAACAWVLCVLRADWSFVRPPLLWASQRRPEGGQPLIGMRRDVGLGAGDGSGTAWSPPGPARRPGAPARGLPADWAGVCAGGGWAAALLPHPAHRLTRVSSIRPQGALPPSPPASPASARASLLPCFP